MVLQPVIRQRSSATEHSHLLTHKPVVDLERRARCRLCLALTIGSVFFCLIGALAVWHAKFNSLRRPWVVANRAALALNRLNHRLSMQQQQLPKECLATILLMRHCEKYGPHVSDEDGNEHCSYLGYQRAQFIPSLFLGKQARWPIPSHLIAYAPDRSSAAHWNFREWETLRPLSLKLDLGIDLFKEESLASHLFDLLQGGHLCGEVVAVAWKHELLPELATSLGCGPDNGCPAEYPWDSFDQVWQLQYVFHDNSSPHANQETKLVRVDTQNTKKKSPAAVVDNIEHISGDALVDVNAEKEEVESVPESASSSDGTRRFLKRTDESMSNHGWNVYATVTQQNFDPLAFAMEHGHYRRANPDTNERALFESRDTFSSSMMHDEI